MSEKVPQLREAVNRSDEHQVRSLVRELRHTVELLGLPKLFQLSQDIEYRREDLDASIWEGQCRRFCDLLERIHFSLEQQRARS
ncbi:MAG TPA: hypothetical protein VK737_01570 [Opitutales bacterium]|nr:hypothetical protein [Opitutales bacterium]